MYFRHSAEGYGGADAGWETAICICATSIGVSTHAAWGQPLLEPLSQLDDVAARDDVKCASGSSIRSIAPFVILIVEPPGGLSTRSHVAVVSS